MSAPTSPETHVVLLTASALSGAQAHGAMLPEAIVLALLYSPALRRDETSPVPEEEELRRALLSSDERPGADGWAPRAQEAYRRAWARAGTRARARSLLGGRLVLTPSRWGVSLVPDAALTLGDLLAGLVGASSLVDRVLRRAALSPTAFDDEGGAPLPEVHSLSEMPSARRVALVALNDDKTAMDFVVHALETRLGLPQLHALTLMYTIHQRGRARIWTGEPAEVARRGAEIVAAAREAGFPLELGWAEAG